MKSEKNLASAPPATQAAPLPSSETITAHSLFEVMQASSAVELNALVVLWSRQEAQRVGEILLIPQQPAGAVWTLGRGIPEPGVRGIELFRQRPGWLEKTGPVQSPRISRAQLKLQNHKSGALQVENVGRLSLSVNGVEVPAGQTTVLAPGDVLELRHELLLMVIKRPSTLPTSPELKLLPSHPFGEADTFGMVGESPASWELRKQVAFVGARNAHVLLLGASGTGKESVAGAIHRLSTRRDKPMIARNAATFPETLIDAELFGNAKNYPNSGMPERPGLVGEADGSTLFLDEIGELPSSLQAHLLRVLDQGEYQRLGDSKTRKSDFRLVAATNRPPQHLKHDVLARMKLRVELPDLNARREDIPLIARYLIQRIAVQDEGIAQRFLEKDASGTLSGVRFTPALLTALVRHPYTTHVRELEALLWQSMSASTGHYLELVEGMEVGLEAAPEPAKPKEVIELTPERIQACLDKHQGVQDHVWPELGLPNRFVLYRLIRKYGLKVKREGEEGAGESGTESG